MNNFQITSPNDWLNKVGVTISENGKMTLPPTPFILPLTTASESIDNFNNGLNWSEQIKIIQSIALNVRSVDSTYFSSWSSAILAKNINFPSCFPCSNCFKSTMSSSSLRHHVSPKLEKLRESVNKEVIHFSENGFIITPDKFSLAEGYYDEFLKINLFQFPQVNSLPLNLCRIHKNHNQQYKS